MTRRQQRPQYPARRIRAPRIRPPLALWEDLVHAHYHDLVICLHCEQGYVPHAFYNGIDGPKHYAGGYCPWCGKRGKIPYRVATKTRFKIKVTQEVIHRD